MGTTSQSPNVDVILSCMRKRIIIDWRNGNAPTVVGGSAGDYTVVGQRDTLNPGHDNIDMTGTAYSAVNIAAQDYGYRSTNADEAMLAHEPEAFCVVAPRRKPLQHGSPFRVGLMQAVGAAATSAHVVVELDANTNLAYGKMGTGAAEIVGPVTLAYDGGITNYKAVLVGVRVVRSFSGSPPTANNIILDGQFSLNGSPWIDIGQFAAGQALSGVGFGITARGASNSYQFVISQATLTANAGYDLPLLESA